MAKDKNSKASEKAHKNNGSHYAHVSLEDFRRGRRGKHHPLLESVLEDLKALPPGSALKIPVEEFGDLGVSRIRSAVNRATRSRDIEISTHFDGDFLYVWKPAPDAK
jgi:hypothetical protein